MRKRPGGIALGVALLAAAGGGVFLLTSAGNGKRVPAGETVTVERRTIDDIIEVSGHLKPQAEQDIRAPSAGLVQAVYVKAGDSVKKGDPIAALDSSEASFELERLGYQMEQERFAGNRRKIELLEAELAMRRRVVDDLTIRAHLDGKISRIDLKAGDVLKAGESYGRVIDVRTLVADVEIAEVDIPRARVGLAADFQFPALPGVEAKGSLVSFPAEARINNQGLTVLDAKLEIAAPPKGILPAYTFRAVIVAGEPREVLVVDSRAVTYRAGKPEIERKKPDGGWEKAQVSTEGYGAGLVRLVSGASEGDELRISAPTEEP